MYVRYPNNNQIIEYPTFSDFPATANDGDLALALDTDNLYAFNSGSNSWVQIGGPSVVLGMGPFDSGTPSIDGAHIDGNELIMQSASPTVPGEVNTTDQTFAGNKHFQGTIDAANLSGTNTGDVTLGTANGLTLVGQVLSQDLVVNAVVSPSAAIARSKLASGTAYRIIANDSSGVMSENAAITASRAVVSDTNGQLAASATTATELGYVNGVTSSIQTQLNAKQSTSLTSAHILVGNASNVATDVAMSGDVAISNTGVTTIQPGAVDLTTDVTGVLPVANGGTNSSTALNNNRIMQSSGSKIVEAAAITASRALVSDANGIPIAATTTATEIGFVNGVTSSIQTQLNAKQSTTLTSAHLLVGNASNVATDTAITGDVTISNTGVTAIGSNKVTNSQLAQAATLTLKGNNTGGTANVTDLTVSQVNTMLGTFVNPMTTGGDIIYGGASGTPTRLANGSAGQVLISAGGTSAPSWGTDVLGVATNSNASSGYKGEYVESLISTLTNMTTGNGMWFDLTSISLTAGDWDVTAGANGTAVGGGAPVGWLEMDIGISTTSGNSATGLTQGVNWFSSPAPVNNNRQGVTCPVYRLSLSSTTTVYLKFINFYTSGTPQINGARISARRVR